MKRTIALLACVLIFAAALLPAKASSGELYSSGSTGEMVVRIQLRLAELGYLDYKPTGAYRSLTVEAVKAFQQRCCDVGNTTGIDGVMGPETMKLLFANNAPRAIIADSVHMAIGPTAENLAVTGEAVDWSEIKAQLTAGTAYSATDCNTGESFTLTYSGGENHAEMELTDVEDIDTFLHVCGEEFNFYKRPIVVKIGDKLIAASMQCYPHGSESVAGNGMEGHICVFFLGSLSHVGSLPDIEHNANVYKAAGR